MPSLDLPTSADAVFTLARGLLNDQNITLWTDDVLMIYLQYAHIELQARLRNNAAHVMKGYADVTVPAFAITLATPPDDLLAPIKLWEKPSGTPIESFRPMTEYDPLPNISPTNVLSYWMWFQEQLMFIGCTQPTDIFITYWRRIPIPNAGSDPIGILEGELYLAPRTLALAAGAVGEDQTAAMAGALAESNWNIVSAANRGRAPQVFGQSTRP
jgi:hypothetical protein